MITFENVVKQQRQAYFWHNATNEAGGLKFKDILILVNVTATDAVYPTLIQYAREHRWRLTIEDRMSPPQGWRADRETSCTAFADAMDNCGVLKWCWPLEAGARRTNNRNAMTRWIQTRLKKAPKPLAVFCPNAYNAVTFLNICLDMGITVPDEVAIVCDKYDPVFCDCQAVPITGIEFNSGKKADEAAKLLDRLIDGDLPAPLHVTIPPERIAVQQSTDVVATETPFCVKRCSSSATI